MLIVISPAKKLDFENPAQTDVFTNNEHLDDAQLLINTLREKSPEDIGQLMHISESLSTLNHQRYQDWQTPFNLQNAKQALLAFKGDVYAGLNADTFNEHELAFAQKHLRMLSGLYGVLRPLDLMQPYRLEMGTRLNNIRGKTLYEFWGARITDSINAALKESGSDTLINLASQEYFKSVHADSLDGHIITPHFKELKNGKLKVIGIYAKRARGLMSRFIIENKITSVEDIKVFSWDGYRYDHTVSDEKNWIFSR